MDEIRKEKRRHPRYDTEMKVFFEVKYDTKIRVEYQVLEDSRKGGGAKKYPGLCRNVSAEGILIVSRRQLVRGDFLLLEVYEPIVKEPVRMEGLVRWCETCPDEGKDKGKYRAGVQVISVNGVKLYDSIYFDKKFAVIWSALLESIFGTFAAMKKIRD